MKINYIIKNLNLNKILQCVLFFLTVLIVLCVSNTKTSLLHFILVLSILATSYSYHSRVYEKLEFIIFIVFSFLLFSFAAGLLGIYFLVCFFISIFLYLRCKPQYFTHIGFLAFLGFVISFLFFKLYLLYEVENILFTAQHLITFIGNPEALTVTWKIMLENSYLPYPNTELQFLLNSYGFDEAFSFLTQFKPIESSTYFVLLYAYSVQWVFSTFIPFIKIYFIIA